MNATTAPDKPTTAQKQAIVTFLRAVLPLENDKMPRMTADSKPICPARKWETATEWDQKMADLATQRSVRANEQAGIERAYRADLCRVLAQRVANAQPTQELVSA